MAYIRNASKSVGVNEGTFIGTVTARGEEHLISIQVMTDGGKSPWVRIKPEDLVAALKDHPGLTISYEEPKPPLPTGIGAVIRFLDGRHVLRLTQDKWENPVTGSIWSNEHVRALAKTGEVISEGVEL